MSQTGPWYIHLLLAGVAPRLWGERMGPALPLGLRHLLTILLVPAAVLPLPVRETNPDRKHTAQQIKHTKGGSDVAQWSPGWSNEGASVKALGVAGINISVCLLRHTADVISLTTNVSRKPNEEGFCFKTIRVQETHAKPLTCFQST